MADGTATKEDFELNAEIMRTEFEAIFESIRVGRGWSRSETALRLGNDPVSFARRLNTNSSPSVHGVVAGFETAGGTANMAIDYAIKRQLLADAERESRLHIYCDCNVTSVTRAPNGKFIANADTREFIGDAILLTAGHQNLRVAKQISSLQPHNGMYHLNAMVYVSLPATRDVELRELATAVNFVIQGKHGCMYACVLPPTETSDGLAALYYPADDGSHIDTYTFMCQEDAGPPLSWDDLMNIGLGPRDEERRVSRIIEQVESFNPALTGYFGSKRVVIRPVFNPASMANPNGNDRRVRQQTDVAPLSNDGLAFSITAPKWTCCELTAFTAIDHLLERLDCDGLPKSKKGFGPRRLDVASITRDWNFCGHEPRKDYAVEYLKSTNLPLRLAERSH